MPDSAVDVPDPTPTPVTDRSRVPVPHLGDPARETTQESLRAEDDAVADGPDTGGLTPTDDAQ